MNWKRVGVETGEIYLKRWSFLKINEDTSLSSNIQFVESPLAIRDDKDNRPSVDKRGTHWDTMRCKSKVISPPPDSGLIPNSFISYITTIILESYQFT